MRVRTSEDRPTHLIVLYLPVDDVVALAGAVLVGLSIPTGGLIMIFVVDDAIVVDLSSV